MNSMWWLIPWLALGCLSYLAVRKYTRLRREWMAGDRIIGIALAILLPPLLAVVAFTTWMEAPNAAERRARW